MLEEEEEKPFTRLSSSKRTIESACIAAGSPAGRPEPRATCQWELLQLDPYEMSVKTVTVSSVQK